MVTIGKVASLFTWRVHPARNEVLWDGEAAAKACVYQCVYVKLEVWILQIPQPDID